MIQEQNEGDAGDEGLDGAAITALVFTFIGALLVLIFMGYVAITYWKPECTEWIKKQSIYRYLATVPIISRLCSKI